jgi:hypothetical protein
MGGRGGTEEPCVNETTIRTIQAKSKTQHCPRVVLTEENEVLAEIAWFAVRLGGDHPLFEKIFNLHTVLLSHEERLAVFERVLAAVSEPGITARIKAARKRDLEES